MKMTEGHIKRLDKGEGIYAKNGDYYFKDGNSYFKHGYSDGEDCYDRLTRAELLEVTDDITSYTYFEKQMLLCDLSARQCYGVKLKRTYENGHTEYFVLHHVCPKRPFPIYIDRGEYLPAQYEVEDVKPMLRRLTSMTEDEKKEIKMFFLIQSRDSNNIWDSLLTISFAPDFVNWCYRNHFDINSLIDMGIAEEVTEENNPYK